MSIVRHHGVIHVRVIPERTRTFERPRTVVGPLVSSFLCPGPRSSGDRAPPSGGGSAGSNPAGGANVISQDIGDSRTHGCGFG
jgi:hypothetical protein